MFSTFAGAQDSSDVVRAYLNPGNAAGGYVRNAECFKRYVTVNASPDWWTFLLADDRRAIQLVLITNGMLDLASNMGLGKVAELDDKTGGKAEFPGVLEMLDSWKGKMQVTINLPAGLDDARKTQFLENYELINGVIGWHYDCLPRGGKFFLTVNCSAKAADAQGKVSKDGNTYDVTIPVYSRITSGVLQTIFHKGLK